MYAFVELVRLYTFRGLPDSFSPSVEDDLLWPVLSPPLTSRELISMLALPLLPFLEWSSSDRGGIGGESGGGVARSSSQDSSPSQGGREDSAAISGLSLTAIMKPVGSIVHMHECLNM